MSHDQHDFFTPAQTTSPSHPSPHPSPGTAQSFPAAPAAPQSFPNAPYPQPPASSGMPARAVVVIVLVAIPVILVVLGILAAIAIPVFLDQREGQREDQREKAAVAETTISFPATLEGLPRWSDSGFEEDQLADMRMGVPDPDSTQLALYGTEKRAERVLVVAAGPRDFGTTDADQRDFFAGVSDALPAGTTASEFEDRPPGRLGGRLTCAYVTGEVVAQVCLAVDSGAAVLVWDYRDMNSFDPELPRRVREAVVSRD